jgi:hypothetical protein
MTDYNIAIPVEVIEAIAARAAELVIEQLERESTSSPVSPYLSVAEAAEYARCSRQRVYDLLSSGAVDPPPGRQACVGRPGGA